MALPSPAHLAHKDQRLPELSLADGTDVAGFCALLPSGPDSVILFAGRERDKPSCGPSLERCPQRPGKIYFRLLAPVTLARTTMRQTHLRGAEKLQGFPNSAHTATDVEGLKGEQGDG